MPHTLVFHLIDLAKKLQKAGYTSQTKFLSYSQAAALIVIDSQKQISQVEIANKLHLKPASVVTLIDELEKLKLAKRQTPAGNRRKYQITLTSTGKIQAQKIKSQTRALEKFLRDQLTGKQADKLYSTVEKLTRSLENWPKNNSNKSTVKEVNYELSGAKQYLAS